MKNVFNWLKKVAVAGMVSTVFVACPGINDTEDEPVELCYQPTLSADLCDPAKVQFTLESTNPYYPLITGATVVLEGMDEEEGYLERVERTVLEETRIIDGVEVHVLEHRDYQDGEIYEIAYNFYVETTDGTVCYFGEDVEYYKDGALDNTDGTWRAGVDGAKPGVIMPANPKVGDSYLQENAPANDALDMGRVVATGSSITINGNDYEDVLEIMDVNPAEGCDEEEPKMYVAGIGEIADVDLKIVSYMPALCYATTVSADLCDPSKVQFTLESTNPYYPLVVGSKVVLEGLDEDGVQQRVERTVLDETRTIDGVEVHVLEHKNFHNGEIHEIAYNFYVESTAGTVCYFGEDVEYYVGGVLDNTHGTWRAGVKGATPGVIMVANPEVGDSYLQEVAPANNAMDMGRVTNVGETVTIGDNTFENVLTIIDSNPVEGCDEDDAERKLYAPGIGEIADVTIVVTEYTSPN